MANFIALINWTDQGIKSVKDSPQRVAAAREAARSHGCEMKEMYLTIGAHDIVAMIDAPDDAAMARFLLSVSATGNVRTTTLKAFSEDEYQKIIAAL